ncbi:transmembrane amino acid transporter protein, partial [Cooperia oncophora]
MVKAMLGTGLLSLPLAFKHAGLFLGLFLTVIICLICLYCMRQVVFAAHFVCNRNGRDLIDYANILRGAVEMGPNWIRHKGYFFKQLLNVNMFVSQLGFCCVYFVFMADNLEDFFNANTSIKLSKAVWMLLLLIPMLSVCSIRRLSLLAPLAMAANFVYIVAIMPIENRMRNPHSFIAWNGVLNSSCLVVLAIFSVTGFYGYLSLGDDVKDTATLNLPMTPFYQTIKLMFVGCIMISYPLQFYVPMERVEKWITRKIP